MVIGSKSIEVAPTGGEKVLRVVNKKHEMGQTLLRTQIPIMSALYYRLGEAGIIEYGVLGSSALGTRIKVPESYKDVRTVTNVIEVTVPSRNEQKLMETMQRAGWVRDDVINYFSITYRSEGGEAVKIPTVIKQEFLYADIHGSKIYLAPIFTPAKFYRGNNGKLFVYDINLESDGEMLMHKIIRGDYRDKQDVAQVAAADDLARLFGPPSMALWTKSFPNKNDERMKKCVMPILNAVRGLQSSGNADPKRVISNLEKLESLLRVHDSETATAA